MRRSPMSDSIHIMPVSVVASKSVQLFGQPSAEAREYPLISELRAVLRNVPELTHSWKQLPPLSSPAASLYLFANKPVPKQRVSE